MVKSRSIRCRSYDETGMGEIVINSTQKQRERTTTGSIRRSVISFVKAIIPFPPQLIDCSLPGQDREIFDVSCTSLRQDRVRDILPRRRWSKKAELKGICLETPREQPITSRAPIKKHQPSHSFMFWNTLFEPDETEPGDRGSRILNG
ncbi:hypothetical protein F2Q69_00003530 [Brassica cretica]|uniref:Uncharacterized protein n=1 Tax=Brassica cretica TaxID=69181 RepID=A0A8S9NWF4_BRACR|nr:hypothetical protein F2Q69_00003530 [Brassica cretica]